MFQKETEKEKGQSIILVAAVLVVILIFVALAVDMSSAYVMRRKLQNGADGAALAAVRRMAFQMNYESFKDDATKDGEILLELNDFAEQNGVGDTDGTLADADNSNVEGVYTDEEGNPINIAVGGGTIPSNAWGVQATVHGIAPTFFGGLLGYRKGYEVAATATAALEGTCTADCLMPIGFEETIFESLQKGQCYNIWNGGGPGNFGWLNWENQGKEYDYEPCDFLNLIEDLDNLQCDSGFVQVGDWVAGTVGSMAGDETGEVDGYDDAMIRDLLIPYVDEGTELLVVVWDQSDGTGCGKVNPVQGLQGLAYHVKGFARVKILGFGLSQGLSDDIVYPSESVWDPDTECIDPPDTIAPHNGFRISARFIDWAHGETGSCGVTRGTMYSPRIIQ